MVLRKSNSKIKRKSTENRTQNFAFGTSFYMMSSVGCQVDLKMSLQNDSVSSRHMQLSNMENFRGPNRFDPNITNAEGINSILYHEVFGILGPYHAERVDLLDILREGGVEGSRKRKRPKQFACLQCGRAFTRKENLNSHLTIHEMHPPHRCEPCGKVFSRRDHLKNHVAWHSRPFECTACGKTFGRREHLSRHQLGGCPAQGGKARSGLSCHLCGKFYSRREHFINHVRWHSGQSPHVCIVCQKAFTRKEHLKNHFLTHTGESPHQCKFCGRIFSRREHLVNHTRQHTGETPFRCEVCLKAFSRKDHLLNHKRLHERENRKALERQGSLEQHPTPPTSAPSLT